MPDHIHFPVKDTFPRSKFSIIVIFLNEGKFRPPPPPTGEANKLWSQLTEPVSQFKISQCPVTASELFS